MRVAPWGAWHYGAGPLCGSGAWVGRPVAGVAAQRGWYQGAGPWGRGENPLWGGHVCVGGPGGRSRLQPVPAQARTHTVRFGHFLHERARASLPPARLRLAPVETGMAMCPLSGPTVTSPHPTFLTPYGSGPPCEASSAVAASITFPCSSWKGGE